MRTFKWKDFKRKGLKKQELKELKMLKENLQDIKEEVLMNKPTRNT